MREKIEYWAKRMLSSIKFYVVVGYLAVTLYLYFAWGTLGILGILGIYAVSIFAYARWKEEKYLNAHPDVRAQREREKTERTKIRARENAQRRLHREEASAKYHIEKEIQDERMRDERERRRRETFGSEPRGYESREYEPRRKRLEDPFGLFKY